MAVWFYFLLQKGHRVDTAFDKELSVLRRRDQQKARNMGATFQRKIKKDLPSSSSRESPFLCASGLSENGGKRDTHLKAKMSSTSESLSSCLMKKWAFWFICFFYLYLFLLYVFRTFHHIRQPHPLFQIVVFWKTAAWVQFCVTFAVHALIWCITCIQFNTIWAL